MKVSLLAYTPNPEKVVAAAAKLCYSAVGIDELLDGLTEEKTTKFVEMLSGMGHESPIEHISFTFGIEGVSRSFLAQMTRHRIASFSVQSQRYVKTNEFHYVTPPEIEAVQEAKKTYDEFMNTAISAYNKLADILEEMHYNNFIKSCYNTTRRFLFHLFNNGQCCIPICYI